MRCRGRTRRRRSAGRLRRPSAAVFRLRPTLFRMARPALSKAARASLGASIDVALMVRPSTLAVGCSTRVMGVGSPLIRKERSASVERKPGEARILQFGERPELRPRGMPAPADLRFQLRRPEQSRFPWKIRPWNPCKPGFGSCWCRTRSRASLTGSFGAVPSSSSGPCRRWPPRSRARGGRDPGAWALSATACRARAAEDSGWPAWGTWEWKGTEWTARAPERGSGRGFVLAGTGEGRQQQGGNRRGDDSRSHENNLRGYYPSIAG